MKANKLNLKPFTCKTKVFETKAQAQKVADELRFGELDGWTYKVTTAIDGHVVRIDDENDKFVSYWTCEEDLH